MSRLTPGAIGSISVTGSDGAIQDGVDTNIKATVKDLSNANPLTVAIVDSSGDQITSFGGGTQYTEGDTDASITGTAILWEDGSDTLRSVSAAKPLPVDLQDSTVAVTQSGAWDEVGINDSGNSITVDNGGTFATQVDGDALTALQLIDDPVKTLGTDTYSEATTKGMVIGAIRRDADTTLVDTTNEVSPLQVDANGRLKVEAFSGETLPVSLSGVSTLAEQQSQTTHLATIAGDTTDIETAVELIDDTVATLGTTTYSEATTKGLVIGAIRRDADTTMVNTTNEAAPLQVDANGRLKVEIFDGADTHSVDWNGTQPVTGSGTATGALRVELPTNGTGVIATVSTVSALGTGTTGPMKAEDVGHSTGDMGIPAWGVRVDTPNATVAANGDYHYKATDMVGGIRTALYETDFAVLGTNHVKKYYTSTGAATDGIVWSPAAGKRWYVTDIIVNVSAAATVTFEDDKAGGDEAVAKFELAANSGITHSFNTPWFSGEDAADLLVTTTAGNIYITITGYEI